MIMMYIDALLKSMVDAYAKSLNNSPHFRGVKRARKLIITCVSKINT